MTHNLAARPLEERQAIEIDKARAFIAHQWLLKFQPYEIRQKLAEIDNDDEREDLRRRLNTMRNHQRYAKNQAPNRKPPQGHRPPTPRGGHRVR